MPVLSVSPRTSIGSSPSPTASLLLGLVIVALSSAAPFIRFGSDGISVSAEDVGNALVFTMAWLPFIIAAALPLRAARVQRLRGHWLLALFLLAVPFVAVAHTILFFTIQDVVFGKAFDGSRAIPFLVLSLLGALQYLVAVALYFADRSSRVAYRARLAAAELEISHGQLQQDLVASRLAVLQAQLQPHFLFNALNSISALVSSNPTAARRMLIDLSALLRRVLDSSDRNLVAVDHEVELVRHYLAIQQVRFGDRLSAVIEVDENTRQLAIPPLLLQPIVENAVHHAMTSDDMNVAVQLHAFRTGDRLVVEVANSGPSPADTRAISREGIGLQNTRERLQQLFGADCLVVLAERSGGGAMARIELPATDVTAARVRAAQPVSGT